MSFGMLAHPAPQMLMWSAWATERKATAEIAIMRESILFIYTPHSEYQARRDRAPRTARRAGENLLN
jgi:hypothetical protein